MTQYDTQTKLKGEQKLYSSLISIEPLFDKYFKQFNSEKITLATQPFCKAFRDAVKAFKEEANQIADFHYIGVEQPAALVWIKFSVKMELADGSGWAYFESSQILGSVATRWGSKYSDGTFQYEFKERSMPGYWQHVVNTTEEQIVVARKRIEELKKEIEKVENGIPYVFRGLIN
ncbi:MAG: hypothetical protein PVI43_00470 [Candidatus Bathyarchaeota archaeon]|jgi:hypothetical protein